MAEEIKETVEQEQVDTQEQTVSVEEMKRRIAKEQEKAQKQIEELNQSVEERIEKAIEETEAKAKMNKDELAEYQQKEAERKHQEELEKRDAQIKELLAKDLQRQIKDEALVKLQELNIPTNATTLSLVQAESLEDMASKAELLAEYTKVIKNEFASSEAPMVGGGSKNTINTDDTYSMMQQLKKQL